MKHKLLRDFIHDRLYALGEGYFMTPNHQLGMLQGPLRYQSLDGIHSYLELLGNEYPENAFLTPVEIFQPWYGHTLAQYILKNTDTFPIRILEIGGGTGTAALTILDYFQRQHRRAYSSIVYDICEISPSIAHIASQRLEKQHPLLWKSKQIRVHNKSIAQWDTSVTDKCFVLGLEVLDNLPHDRVWKNNSQWTLQSEVWEDSEEKKTDLTDPIIRKTLDIYESIPPLSDIEREAEYQEGFVYNFLKWIKKKNHNNLFLPTGAYLMLSGLKKFLKSPHFVFSDFDSLPGALIKGINAPIVSNKGKQAHESSDFNSLIVERGKCDIFFPVDFRLLNYMIYEIFGTHSKVMKAHSFMREHSQAQWTTTKTGYKPLQDDFLNTSFLVSL